MPPYPINPNRKHSARQPSFPGDPLTCPKCEKELSEEWWRDLHYLTEHSASKPFPEPPSSTDGIKDKGNYDGPLGEKRHVFTTDKYCQDPDSYYKSDIPDASWASKYNLEMSLPPAVSNYGSGSAYGKTIISNSQFENVYGKTITPQFYRSANTNYNSDSSHGNTMNNNYTLSSYASQTATGKHARSDTYNTPRSRQNSSYDLMNQGSMDKPLKKKPRKR
ncbi:hypothetical protein B0J14DRAFT_648754 [Halenospora varia]|nr:hypothetical protein B0J14DRAFT_648754 [Halenospora varia]